MAPGKRREPNMNLRASSSLAVLLAAVLARPALAQGADGFSQKVDPTAPRGSPEAAPVSTAAPASVGPAPGKKLATLGLTRGSEPCTGAYFRKVSSQKRTNYKGITGTGVLPHVTFDAARYHVPSGTEGAWVEGPMDIPSVYMGGSASTELDAGLDWDRIYTAEGDPAFTDLPGGTDGGDLSHRFVKMDDGRLHDGNGNIVDAPRVLSVDGAFRPFWRTVYQGKNTWANPTVGAADNVYFFPGERFAMTVEVKGPELVELTIRSLDHPAKVLDVTFHQTGFGVGRATSWKRVNSIDQFREVKAKDGTLTRKGNEDQKIIPTTTRVLGGSWDSVFLIETDGKEEPVVGPAFVEARGGDTAAIYDQVFHRSGFTSTGGETIDIAPPTH
jgi:hypothetical protein